ncbi:MAG: hypothetical protein WCF30_20685 [Terracidiphilus sp.]
MSKRFVDTSVYLDAARDAGFGVRMNTQSLSTAAVPVVTSPGV